MSIVIKNENPSLEEVKKVLAERDSYFGIILEELRDQYKTIIERSDIIEGKLDGLENRINVVEERLDVIEATTREILDDQQNFFKELREVKATGSDYERRIIVLETA